MAHITNTATATIRSFIVNWAVSEEMIQGVEGWMPRPWFDNEQHAYAELMQCIAYIDALPPVSKGDARYRFYKHNMAQLYLKECPSYELFWLMALPERVLEATSVINNNRQRNDVYDAMVYAMCASVAKQELSKAK